MPRLNSEWRVGPHGPLQELDEGLLTIEVPSAFSPSGPCSTPVEAVMLSPNGMETPAKTPKTVPVVEILEDRRIDRAALGTCCRRRGRQSARSPS